MKALTFILTILLAQMNYGQEKYSIGRFKGVILDKDSLPIENAYITSFKTNRKFATDENGRFDVLILKDDSLKIEHISYNTKVIHPMEFDSITSIFMNERINAISAVNVNHENEDTKIMKQNVNGWLDEVRNQYYYTCPVGPTTNPYAPKLTQNSEASINILEVIKWIKWKKKQKNK